jgi:hypothetical protein
MISIAIICAIVGLMLPWPANNLKDAYSLISALLIGLSGYSNDIRPVEILRSSWQRIKISLFGVTI